MDKISYGKYFDGLLDIISNILIRYSIDSNNLDIDEFVYDAASIVDQYVKSFRSDDNG